MQSIAGSHVLVERFVLDRTFAAIGYDTRGYVADNVDRWTSRAHDSVSEGGSSGSGGTGSTGTGTGSGTGP